ncbi:MAG: hypothetical protein B6U75_00100 [Desulfurococcales archaeon ex4484_217_1]|nr:MAG: hypothetical protein B6U75_00100 [Desulfurococcales archaeon ex4484_217_1]
MTSILLLYPTVLTMVSENDVIDEGYIYIDNGKIISAGKVSELPHDYRYADLVLNLRGRIVLPGFISYHKEIPYTGRILPTPLLKLFKNQV